jgi:hypothetical protein
MSVVVAEQDVFHSEIGTAVQREPVRSAAEVAGEALEAALRQASRFAPPSRASDSGGLDIAQRLIDLHLAGNPDELTWASYGE